MTNLPSFNLNGRVALVTGASSGLGAIFAQALAASGAKVVLAARRTDRLAEVRAQIEAAGGEAICVAMDVADAGSIAAGFDAAEAAFGPVNSVIVNAGVANDKMSIDLTEADIDAVLSINLRGAFLTAQEAAKRMIAAGSRESGTGRIVMIGSTTAEKIYPATGFYGATKAAVRHLGKALARELCRKGINVNVIQPGYFRSEMTGAIIDSPLGSQLIASFPRQRIRDSADLLTPMLWLASDASAGITGTVITVDDGQTL